MSLVIHQRDVSDVVILDLTGRLWILDLPLRDLVNRLLASGNRHFVLNLAGVEYIDSSGLGQLITIWTSIRNKTGHMTVLSPSTRVQRLLDITRLTTVFPILDNETDAIEKARKAFVGNSGSD
jgi:anti-sigma B factor antagonist